MAETSIFERMPQALRERVKHSPQWVERAGNRCSIRVWNPYTRSWWRTDLYQESPHMPEAPRVNLSEVPCG